MVAKVNFRMIAILVFKTDESGEQTNNLFIIKH